MGTMIQRKGLNETDFGAGRNGCNDVLVLTRPDVIGDIHRAYIDAGADIIETNSFNANSISMEEYGLQDSVSELNMAAARVARAAADAAGRPVLVAGSMGPTNVSLSVPELAAARGVDFERMRAAYAEQSAALIEGGVDLLMLETIFDTINAKAAIAGIADTFDKLGKRVPLMISVTLTEQGRTLSGQSPQDFIDAILHARPWSIGMNCGFGADRMKEWLPIFQPLRNNGILISLHPNAGLPDELGNYTETPESMAHTMEEYMEKGWIDIAGGCCGTTPVHIRALSKCAKRIENSRFAEGSFLRVGERCNVAGSRKFLRLIKEGNYEEALDIAADQIEKGAGMLDINMDDGMLDAPAQMEKFVGMLVRDARTSGIPLMIDSSDMEVIRRALPLIPGRPIVNSISLKEGEEKFLQNAREIRRLGAQVVVMAFDEEGQATDYERRIQICRRAYSLLTEKAGFRGEEIIFDPNILTIATGMPQHDQYALDFLNALEWIKENLPGARVSGGVSNLSFAFRGNNQLREAMHWIFLEEARKRGMDMAIVNPNLHNPLGPEESEIIRDAILARRPDAAERLITLASELKAKADAAKAASADKGIMSPKENPKKRVVTLEERIISGNPEGLGSLIDEALKKEGSAMAVVNRRLMAAMNTVGDDFGAGKVFLPQVVRASGVMELAMDILNPLIAEETKNKSGEGTFAGEPFVLATVKGDVHDIGKNIVAVILRCGGFDVTDLGVMVTEDKILEALHETGAKFLGLSGLITPSLKEMQNVAAVLEREGLTDVNLFVGGATTSDLHTAVKIAPEFSGVTIHTRDAARLPAEAKRLADPDSRAAAVSAIKAAQQKLRDERAENQEKITPAMVATEDSNSVNPELNNSSKIAAAADIQYSTFKISIAEAAPEINWKAFLHTWHLKPAQQPSGAEAEEAARLIADAKTLLAVLDKAGVTIDARVATVGARPLGDAIALQSPAGEVIIPTPRKQGLPNLALSDFLAAEGDFAGIFAVTAKQVLNFWTKEKEKTSASTGLSIEKGNFSNENYRELLLQSVADRLVEAATEVMHTRVHSDVWKLTTPRSIRPAVGYASLPDHRVVFDLDKILDYASIGVGLTENGALMPSSTTTGLIFANPEARYF